MPPVIHDITLPLGPDLPVWPGDPRPVLRRLSDQAAGDEATVTTVAMSAHAGTHVDAPSHYLPGGAAVDQLDLTALIGPAVVVHLPDADAVTAAMLAAAGLPPGTARLLLRTRNSDCWARGETAFRPDFVAVTPDGAHWLVDHAVRLVGVDGLSVAPYDQTAATHVILLGGGVIPLEGLDLSRVAPGVYHLVCLPLRLAGADGAPARAVLIADR